MSTNICSLTHQPISQGVVSTKSGHLFQKSIIFKHLSSFPYCPITNQPMQLSDLVCISSSSQQKQLNLPQQSILSYLQNIKNQYDILILENFYMKAALNKAKVELAHSLTANEAAVKVIAKFIKDNQQADKELEKMECQLQHLKK